jgi:hypothetical protein
LALEIAFIKTWIIPISLIEQQIAFLLARIGGFMEILFYKESLKKIRVLF